MSAVMMWLGLAVFLLAFVFVNTAKTQQRYLHKLGKAPDEKYKKLTVSARVLFAIGMAFWIAGVFMTIAAGGK